MPHTHELPHPLLNHHWSTHRFTSHRWTIAGVLFLLFVGRSIGSVALADDVAVITNGNQLDPTTADSYAKLVLKGVDTEFPNKMSLVYSNKQQIRSPKETFPAFYGSFDWHSSVHGHWVLVKLLKTYPKMESAAKVRETLKRHLTKENLKQEADFFAKEEQKSFERMYGWSWYLRLVMEVDQWQDTDAIEWRENLRPLEQILVDRIGAYLPKLTYPIRTGQHTDTAFALGQVIDYARSMKREPLLKLATTRSRSFYLEDKMYPVQYEPSGHDFFSPCWNEADLMRRVLNPAEFSAWLTSFLPKVVSQLKDGTISPVSVSDINDGKLVHLAGLNLSRAWCMRGVASKLADSDPRRAGMLASADQHLTAGLRYINSGSYDGDHWLATFGLYAICQESTNDNGR